MCLTMKERKPLFREYAPLFKKATKKDKTQILNKLTEITKLHRKHIAWVLRNHGKKVKLNNRLIFIGDVHQKRQKSKRAIIYDNDFKKALKHIWYYSDCISSKRLKEIIPEMIKKVEQFNEYSLTDEIRDKLLKVSHGKIDELLRSERKKIQLKHRSHTKPGGLLKHQIPIRTFADWNEKEPGYLEIDLVGHDGGTSRGDFCFTLNSIDINTCWADFQAIRNKAHQWTKEAVIAIKSRLPFAMKGIDSDSGAEFINHCLKNYCDDNKIQFTRGRSYRKNDNCYVEQKNSSVIRRAVFHYRYDTEKELIMLNDLYDYLRLYINFFQPSTKLIEKVIINGKTKKKYEKPKTPYQRVLESNEIPEDSKRMLRRIYKKLNPFELKRNITKTQDKLVKFTMRKLSSREQYGIDDIA